MYLGHPSHHLYGTINCSFQGASVEADGPDGRGQPAASVRQRPHLPRQLHLRQLRL